MKKGISVCMIVKNEERSLSRCLDSIKDIADEIIIVDTGSTDKTIEIAESFNARIYHFDWINDFSAARNESIKYANYNWIFLIDADEVLEKDSKNEIQSLEKNHKHPSLLQVRIVSETSDQNFNESKVARIFSNGYNLKFKNNIHEQINEDLINPKNSLNKVRTNIILSHDGYNINVIDQKNKQDRNIPLLKKMMQKEKEFYYWPYTLAISYMSINQNDKALKYLKISYKESLQSVIKASILDLIGVVHKSNNEWELVKEYALRSLSLEKKQFTAYMLLTYYYNEVKNFKQSLKYVESLSHIYNNLNDKGSALINDISVPLDTIKNYKAIALHGLNRFDKAMDIFLEVKNNIYNTCKLEGKDPAEDSRYKIVLTSAIGCSRDMNDSDKVIELVNEFLNIEPDNMDAIILIAEAFTLQKDFNNSLKFYLKANSISPDNKEIQKKIATMFTLLGNQKKAEEWLFKMAGISNLP